MVARLSYFPAHPANIEKALSKFTLSLVAPGKQLQLLIIILPKVSGSYGKLQKPEFKFIGDIALTSFFFCREGLSVCVKQSWESFPLMLRMIFFSSLGGRNTVLLNAVEKKIPFETDMPTIIFGADVTHPQPGEDSSLSIAAVSCLIFCWFA